MDKPAWRKELLNRRTALPAVLRRRAGRTIAHTLLALPEITHARHIAIYADFRGKVPTARTGLLLYRAGKTLALPVVDPRSKRLIFRRIEHWHQLCPGPYGLRQPGPGCQAIAPADLDLVIVPAVGFDRGGYRLGYGGGYYDRFLPELGAACVTLGLAFACQVVPALPHGPLDQTVDIILTEDEVIRIGGKAVRNQ